MLGRSLPKVSAVTAEAPAAFSLPVPTAAEDESISPVNQPSRHELLQSFVRDNPDATAAVIGRWVQAAK
jgi:hypothetical protein